VRYRAGFNLPIEDMAMQQYQEHLPARSTAERYHVVLRTLNRWLENPKMDFPRPLVINGRRYFKKVDLETWERRVSNPAA
jgi:hypothetical protein